MRWNGTASGSSSSPARRPLPEGCGGIAGAEAKQPQPVVQATACCGQNGGLPLCGAQRHVRGAVQAARGGGSRGGTEPLPAQAAPPVGGRCRRDAEGIAGASQTAAAGRKGRRWATVCCGQNGGLPLCGAQRHVHGFVQAARGGRPRGGTEPLPAQAAPPLGGRCRRDGGVRAGAEAKQPQPLVRTERERICPQPEKQQASLDLSGRPCSW